MLMLPPALFIMGPTSAGKTSLAIELSKVFPVEIISVDSALVYKGMDIGTAKPSAKDLEKYPHHLVNIIDPSDHYSAGNFRYDAMALMADISAKGKIPLLVGGSMLYFRVLQQGFANLPPADPRIRICLENEVEQHGLAHLYARLMDVDPVSAQRIHINDIQRLQRAMEVYEITGKSMTELTKDTQQTIPYRVIKIILSPFDRSVLHQRIAIRYKRMMENNFIAEVEKLFVRNDCHANLPSIRAVGYRQAWSYLSGEYNKQIFMNKAIIATRQMAKRQLTWLKTQTDGMWFDSGAGFSIEIIVQFLRKELKYE